MFCSVLFCEEPMTTTRLMGSVLVCQAPPARLLAPYFLGPCPSPPIPVPISFFNFPTCPFSFLLFPFLCRAFYSMVK